MSLRATARRGLDFWSEHGTIRTLGGVAKVSGRTVNDRCQALARLWESDRGGSYPIGTRVRAARMGFTAETYLWLGLEDADGVADRYLPSPEPFERCNSSYLAPFRNKYIFQLLTAPYVDRLPEMYGTVTGGEFRSAGSSDADPMAVLDAGEKLVVKPFRSSGGSGVRVVERGDEGLRVDGDSTVASTVEEVLVDLDGYLLTEFVRQHEYAAAVAPYATNTVRIHTLVDPKTGAIEVLRPSHRFATRASAPTDNWSRGGYTAPVDPETGELGRLIVLGDPPRSRLDCHPETRAQVAGVRVPYWDELRDLVREVADLHSPAPFVGWDVAVTPDGPVLLEGNATPSVLGLQLEAGLLEDRRVRRLLERHRSGGGARAGRGPTT